MDPESECLLNVTGNIIGFTESFGFFEFTDEQGDKKIANFKPFLLYKDGKKIIRGKKRLEKVSPGDEVYASYLSRHDPKDTTGAKFIGKDGKVGVPSWYSHVIWMGEVDPPPSTLDNIKMKFLNGGGKKLFNQGILYYLILHFIFLIKFLFSIKFYFKSYSY